MQGIHHLPTHDKSARRPPIRVQVQNTPVKEKWLQAQNGLRDLAQSDNFLRLFINENLTRINRELFRLIRTKGNEKGYNFVWTRDGKVLARKAEEALTIRIEKLSDLEKLV